ncbi:hypothetical protein PF010_g29301 [Phytophthora fragariae]|uniref:Uncharacterized protein n=1 Tax=Phytophthora fragariae TaxID=53985 RepID=A0A6A3PQK7_9STRA|nr:hypothetical protein PF009_g30031 [Phytophthora fragariae]KAE9062678.1 hypothetical protein PF010_g29301 [Phytophthora fragariae]KAE9063663.1 hypothetical protein PF007_g29473 [Phytophthora fragariae]KAE9068366.1 hypothetical protein PF006_g29803 [Phytophthora fragariae]KAE9269200.1 hypothetical protein PF001_g29333 [Phytophthora fragariae]
MQFRSVFLDCALYAPTTKANERRKQKLNAIVARFQFLSRNVELFGYYGFLRLIEKGAHDNLVWLGGKAAKHSASAKAAKADHDDEDVPAQEDLATVLRTNPSRYKVIIGRILDPSRVDEDGYASIPELLEQTHALDPARPEHLRLSNRALARVVLDVQGNDPLTPTGWVTPTAATGRSCWPARTCKRPSTRWSSCWRMMSPSPSSTRSRSRTPRRARTTRTTR